MLNCSVTFTLTSLSFQCNFNWYPDRTALFLLTSSRASLTAGSHAWPPCQPPLPPIGNMPPMCNTLSPSWTENGTWHATRNATTAAAYRVMRSSRRRRKTERSPRDSCLHHVSWIIWVFFFFLLCVFILSCHFVSTLSLWPGVPAQCTLRRASGPYRGKEFWYWFSVRRRCGSPVARRPLTCDKMEETIVSFSTPTSITPRHGVWKNKNKKRQIVI